MSAMNPMPGSASIPPDPEKALAPSNEQAITAQVVRDLYDRSRIAILIMLVLIGVIRWTLEPAYQVDGRIRNLFLLLIVVNVLRWCMSLIPAQYRDDLVDTRAQLLAFTTGVAISSLTLGAMLFLAWPQMDTTRIAILAVITSGLVSGAVMSIGFSPLVYMIYMIPPVGALLFRAMTDPRPAWGAGILATSFAIYAVAVFTISLDQRRTRRQAIDLSLRLSDLVVRDTLTKLHNRRFLQEFMPVEAARIARDATDIEFGRKPTRNTIICVYMLDLDFFKQVNDTYGHPAGDAVLRQTAVILTDAMRKSDNLVRWGGGEFVAVAWVKQLDHARVVAEKLRQAVEHAEYLLPDGQILRKTVSIGYSVMPFLPDQPRGLTWEQVLALADAALYIAKTEGRNRWVGALCGATPWPDVSQTYANILRDLREAEGRALISLERFAAATRSSKT
jgi:diguanylate cyclase (GGDEF)-like protein